jgi:hypothetical protein
MVAKVEGEVTTSCPALAVRKSVDGAIAAELIPR